MRILAVNKFFWRKGGSEAVFFGEKDLLEAHGHTVVPFSMKHPNNEASPYEKYFIENVDYGEGGLSTKVSAASKIIYSFEAKKKMNSLLAVESFDLAHFHIFQHQISPSVFGPLRQHGIPIVLTLHDLKPLCPNYKMYTNGHLCEACRGGAFYNCLLNRCTKGSILKSAVNVLEMYFHTAMKYYQKDVAQYIAVSRFYRDKMLEYGFPKDKVSYLPNSVSLEGISPSSEDLGYALYFGRLSEEKGLGTLLNAARLCPNIPVKVAGGGPLEKALKTQAESQSLKNVEFVGFKTGDALRKLIAGCSFTVIPSEWYENCPMSVLESFAFGKPVVGSRIGGIPELIDEKADGLVFDPGNSEDLAGQMQKLWSKGREARHDMGQNGHNKVRTHYSGAAHYEGLMSIYQKVLGRRQI